METFDTIKPFPLLKTERLSLRKFTENDLDFLYSLRSDKTVTDNAGIKIHESLSETEELLNKIISSYTTGGDIWWILCLKQDQTPIGDAGIWNIQKEHLKGELGYMLKPDYFRKGYMTEVLKVIIDFGFNKLSLHRLEAYIDSCNISSINLLKKFGFEQEAFLREDYIFNGNFRNSVIMSKLKSEN